MISCEDWWHGDDWHGPTVGRMFREDITRHPYCRPEEAIPKDTPSILIPSDIYSIHPFFFDTFHGWLRTVVCIMRNPQHSHQNKLYYVSALLHKTCLSKWAPYHAYGEDLIDYYEDLDAKNSHDKFFTAAEYSVAESLNWPILQELLDHVSDFEKGNFNVYEAKLITGKDVVYSASENHPYIEIKFQYIKNDQVVFDNTFQYLNYASPNGQNYNASHEPFLSDMAFNKEGSYPFFTNMTRMEMLKDRVDELRDYSKTPSDIIQMMADDYVPWGADSIGYSINVDYHDRWMITPTSTTTGRIDGGEYLPYGDVDPPAVTWYTKIIDIVTTTLSPSHSSTSGGGEQQPETDSAVMMASVSVVFAASIAWSLL